MKKFLTMSILLLITAASLMMAACSGQQTVLNTTEAPTQATEVPSLTAKATKEPTPEPTEAATEEPSFTPEPPAEPFDLPEYDFEYDKDKFEVMTMFFPANKRGKTEKNAHVYDINPFAVRFIVPKGWTYKGYTDKREMFMGNWGESVFTDKNNVGRSVVNSTLWIYNEKNECVGAIGYELAGSQTQEPIANEQWRNPKFIYCSVRRFFMFNSRYEIVPNNWDNETALTETYYSRAMLYPEIIVDEPYSNPGILSYDYDARVFIAMELDKNTISDELVLQIAKSLQLISK